MDPREDGGLIGPFALTKDQLSKLESVSEVIGTVNIPAPNAVSPNVTVELDLEGRSAPRYMQGGREGGREGLEYSHPPLSSCQ